MYVSARSGSCGRINEIRYGPEKQTMHLTPEARERVQQIADRQGGRITPDDLIADARKKTSPLHAMFQWDVDKAAHQHWLETARSIIRSVRIEVKIDRKAVNVVAYVRDPQRQHKEQGYVALRQAADDPTDAASIMAYELGRAEACLKRALDVAEVLRLAKPTREALARVVGLKEKVAVKRNRSTVGVGVSAAA